MASTTGKRSAVRDAALVFCRFLPPQFGVLEVLHPAAEFDAPRPRRAALVRSEIARRSSSATIAIMPTVSRLAFFPAGAAATQDPARR